MMIVRISFFCEHHPT